MVSAASRAGLLLVFVGAALSFRYWGPTEEPASLRITLEPRQIVADGHQTTTLTVQSSETPRISLLDAHSGLRLGSPVRDGEAWQTRLRAGVVPGQVSVRVAAGTSKPVTATLRLNPYFGDREQDGTPDALRLDTEQDRQAFRRWFTFLAEVQYFQDDGARPAEINDCAALIRYAYHEALRQHDDVWVAGARLPLVLGLDSVAKYQYPYTLLGPSLFRVKPGPFRASDLSGAAFSQFADAKTLQRYNTYFVTRDLRRASPGDLLFFRHEAADMPFHSMIWLGRSQIRDDGRDYLLYHTGPDGSDPGEVRRPAVEELLRHPNPEWRPLPGNPTFLGVYRWNILQ